MQRTRRSDYRSYRSLAPWIVAGAMLLATGSATFAQDPTPPPETTGLEVVAEDASEAAPAEAVVEAPAEGEVVVAADPAAAPAEGEAAAEPAEAQEDDDGGGGGGRNREGRGGGDDVAAIPATGVGAGLTGLDLFTVGATVSAAAAAAAALRARMANR